MIDTLLADAAATTEGFGGPAGIWASIVKDFSNITEPAAFAAFFQVLMIDLVLAGDNAIVVGALAAGLPAEQRKKVIFIGVIAALVLRIIFALVVTQLMQMGTVDAMQFLLDKMKDAKSNEDFFASMNQ